MYLLVRQIDADDGNLELAREIETESSPAAADVENFQPRFE